MDELCHNTMKQHGVHPTELVRGVPAPPRLSLTRERDPRDNTAREPHLLAASASIATSNSTTAISTLAATPTTSASATTSSSIVATSAGATDDHSASTSASASALPSVSELMAALHEFDMPERVITAPLFARLVAHFPQMLAPFRRDFAAALGAWAVGLMEAILAQYVKSSFIHCQPKNKHYGSDKFVSFCKKRKFAQNHCLTHLISPSDHPRHTVRARSVGTDRTAASSAAPSAGRYWQWRRQRVRGTSGSQMNRSWRRKHFKSSQEFILQKQ